MARRSQEEEFEEVDETPAPSRGPQPPRLSVTLNRPGIRKKIRIAAARADLDVGEWCRAVLVAAANKTIEKLYPGGI